MADEIEHEFEEIDIRVDGVCVDDEQTPQEKDIGDESVFDVFTQDGMEIFSLKKLSKRHGTIEDNVIISLKAAEMAGMLVKGKEE